MATPTTVQHVSLERQLNTRVAGATSFDNIGGAFLLIFQVLTLSTWYEMDYYTSMTTGWYSTWFYTVILVLVGFIVSQLFVAIVCFGFDKLESGRCQPVFTDAVCNRDVFEHRHTRYYYARTDCCLV